MPGDEWQRFANLRLLIAYMYAQTGKKLLFMGGELGQYEEWNHDSSVDWHLLQWPIHRGAQSFVRDCNRVYREQRALHERDCEGGGLEWIEANDGENSVLAFARVSAGRREQVIVALNFTPVVRQGYRVGVERPGFYAEILNSDAGEYAGSGVGNFGGVHAEAVSSQARPHSLVLTLPPLGALFLRAPD
jgi:1,4-alpha-glucan branching enzyme